jgi:predicted nuclease of predicted toxin-antitoxin system
VASFLVDECVARDVHEALRELGHEIILVRERFQGSDDEEIFQYASSNGLVVITEDRRFGSLAINYPVRPTAGVVIVLMGNASPPEKAKRISSVLPALAGTLANNINVIGPTFVRRRPL